VAAAGDRFKAIGVALAISPVECLRICRDKQLLMEAVQGKVPIPANEPLTEAVAARVDSFPRFAKPREGAGSRGVAKINSHADLDRQPKDGSVMLQEYLPGEEYSVDVYVRRDGRVIAAVPRDRMKIDSGIAVASRTLNLPDLMQSAIRTAEVIGIRGCANVQFKRAADGIFKLLEVNPRFPGTLPLTTAAGIDMPKLMVDELMGRPVPDKLMPFKEMMVVRYWTEHFFDAGEWEALCRQH
ncbi:MAG: ATP-grasp domain-containing protein, partial [Alphaproteobacteria bacterium]